MASLCFKCAQNANIKINVLKYCNKCFLQLFESKLLKNIPKVASNPSILLYLNDSPISKTIFEFIYKIFKNRPIKKFEVCCMNKSFFNYKIDGVSILEIIKTSPLFMDIYNIVNLHEAIEYCQIDKFDYLFYFEELDKVIVNSLSFLCQGRPEEAVNNSIGISCDYPKIVNLLQDIKTKEVMYYLYLMGNKEIFTIKPKCKINEILSSFLAEIDDKNGLALFNIQNTFRKLSDDKKI